MISRDDITTSLNIDSDGFGYSPVAHRDGFGNLSSEAPSLSKGAKKDAHQLFGEQLSKLLDELNKVLAA